jgi:hypothetical protein
MGYRGVRICCNWIRKAFFFGKKKRKTFGVYPWGGGDLPRLADVSFGDA